MAYEVARAFARRTWMVPTAALLLGLVLLGGCGDDNNATTAGAKAPGAPAPLRGRVVIFHAASLARPFGELERIFEAEHAGVDVVLEPSSSRVAIRKVTELNRPADIVASADRHLLRDLFLPDHARWMADFACDRIVIAYTDHSKYRSEINADNWYRILLRPDVGYGYSDPAQAPVGYRTLLAWKLADLHYKDKPGGQPLFDQLLAGCPERNIRPHCNELLPLLESLGLDYIFEYKAVAMQHHLEWLKLPDEIDLGSEKLAARYRRVSVEVPGVTRKDRIEMRGEASTYAITLAGDAPNPEAATAFLQLLLGERGRKVLEDSFMEPLAAATCSDLAAAPEALRGLMVQEQP